MTEFRIEAFRPEDLVSIKIQPAQAHQVESKTIQYGEKMLSLGEAYTAFSGDDVLACGGLILLSPGRAMLWGLFSAGCGRRMLRLVRAIRFFIGLWPVRRIEAVVDDGFEEGHRLLTMLGFEREGLMKRFNPDGSNCHLYAKVN